MYNSFEMKKNLDFKPGDTLKVTLKGQPPFEGICLARHGGNEPGATFTLRAIVAGVGVEKIYPLHSPLIEKIEIKKKGKVKRAKLYYLRKVSR